MENNISDLLIADECSCGDVIVEEQENHAPLQHAVICVSCFLVVIDTDQNHFVSIKFQFITCSSQHIENLSILCTVQFF